MSGRIEVARQAGGSAVTDLTAGTEAGARGAGTAIALILGTGLAYLVLVALFWMGPLGADDAKYWVASSEWLKHFPSVAAVHYPYGDAYHLALRHTLVIPMALTRLVLGDGLPALVLSTMVATFALIVLVVLWVWRVSDLRGAILAAALLVTSPLLILPSSTASIDPVEAVLVFAVFALLARAFRNGPSWPTLLAAGTFAALALMSRETSVFALVALGLLFLAGYGMERRWYLVIGLGFLIIAGAEMGSYWVLTGNPLYRYTISLHHDEAINRWVEQGSGTPIVHPLIDPVIMLLLSHYFGLLFWVGLPLAVWLVWRVRLSAPARQLVVLLAVLSLTWAVLSAALWQQLTLVPRYYLVLAVGVSVLAALGVNCLWQRGRMHLPIACATVLLLGNLAGLAGDNRNYMFGEHVLVSLATDKNAIIHTDSESLRRAEMMLEWAGAERRVVRTAPGPGELYFYNPTRVPSGFHPGKGWTVIGQSAPPASLAQRVLQLLPGISLPAWLLKRIGPGHPGVTLYRAG
jgi:hypothetical protein